MIQPVPSSPVRWVRIGPLILIREDDRDVDETVVLP